MSELSRRLLIRLDSGGAKTAALLCGETGRVLARVRDIGAPIVGLPDLRFYKVVGRALARLCEQAKVALADVERVAMGLSGVDDPDEQAEQHRPTTSPSRRSVMSTPPERERCPWARSRWPIAASSRR